MTGKRIKKKIRKAFSLIEALILIAMFSIVSLTFYQVFNSGTQLIAEAKRKITAVNLASEKMEEIRGMYYADIETKDNESSSALNPDYIKVVENYQYRILTTINYHDDPEDGIFPDDQTPNDYKRITVTVKWGSEGDSQAVSLYSIVAPFGIETEIDGGVLVVSVMDMNGSPVTGASVQVLNNSITPEYNSGIEQTDALGKVAFHALEEASQSYEIYVWKTEYEKRADGSAIGTMAPYPTTSFYPVDVHATVVDKTMTSSVIILSKQSNIQFKFIDAFSGNVSGVSFALEGGRILGKNADESWVYDYSETLFSDSSGVKNLFNVNPGSYMITVNNPDYLLWKTNSNKGTETYNELIVEQGAIEEFKEILLMKQDRPSYFLQVTDSITKEPLQAVKVELSSSSLGGTSWMETDRFGYVYFPFAQEEELINGETYQIGISFAGYESKNFEITINDLVKEMREIVAE